MEEGKPLSLCSSGGPDNNYSDLLHVLAGPGLVWWHEAGKKESNGTADGTEARERVVVGEKVLSKGYFPPLRLGPISVILVRDMFFDISSRGPPRLLTTAIPTSAQLCFRMP